MAATNLTREQLLLLRAALRQWREPIDESVCREIDKLLDWVEQNLKQKGR